MKSAIVDVMIVVWAWVHSNPALAWPMLSAAIVLLLKPRSRARYAAMASMRPVWFWSRFAPMLQLVGALGLDPVKARKVLWKIVMGTSTPMVLLIAALLIPACGETKAALYGVTLQECNRNAITLCESIDCENRARARAHRPLREIPSTCAGKDAGHE